MPPGDDASCDSVASAPPAVVACQRDENVRSLRARFRADVETSGEKRTAEGVLLWQAPGSLRVKLFTLAGLTVYDAVWSGDATRLRGVVRQPLRDRVEEVTLGPDEAAISADADLSLVLWSLWQPRCKTPPEPAGGDVRAASTTRLALDAAPARAASREVAVAEGIVREEVLLRPSASGASAVPERVVARYDAYDCSAAPPLPRRIELDAPASGWRARVTIVEQTRNVPLDPALFEVAPAGAG